VFGCICPGHRAQLEEAVVTRPQTDEDAIVTVPVFGSPEGCAADLLRILERLSGAAARRG
jgi:hypothetical protein